MSHSARNEEDYIEALETVRATLTEGRETGATDFFIGGDLNIEFRLDNENKDLHCLDSVFWYGMYGPGCRGAGEDAIAYENKIAVATAVESLWLHCDKYLDKQRG